MGQMKNVSKNVGDNPQGKRYRGICKHRREENIEVDLKWVRKKIGGFTRVRIRASGRLI
jgi:hypothetical protein